MDRRAPSEGVTRTQRRIEELRQGDAYVPVRDASGRLRRGVPVWVEQERHHFLFGCALMDPTHLSEADRERYRARLGDLFDHLVPADQTALDATCRRVDLTEPVHLGLLLRRLDDLANAEPLLVHVWGDAVGM